MFDFSSAFLLAITFMTSMFTARWMFRSKSHRDASLSIIPLPPIISLPSEVLAEHSQAPPSSPILSTQASLLPTSEELVMIDAAKQRIADLEHKKQIAIEKRSTRHAELETLVHPEDLPTSYNGWPYEDPTPELLAEWNTNPEAAAYAKNLVELVQMIEEEKQHNAYQKPPVVETNHGIDYIRELDKCTLRIIMCEDIWRAAEYYHRMAPIGKSVIVLDTTFRERPDHGAIYWMLREDTPARWRRMKYLY
jgi:hypothetical protein